MDKSLIDKALDCLTRGDVILYPTDTIWGIGCIASNSDAVEKIYSIKRRDHSKSMLILADRTSFRTGNKEIDSLLLDSSRPTTVIMPTRLLPSDITLASNLPADDGTIGVRLPNHYFCQELISRLAQPIVSTSANFSGLPSPTCYEEISDELKSAVDYCVPNTPDTASGGTSGSKIVKVEPDGSTTIIRN
jgi:L-threonylcarbamoyladenylate synthase